jgi:hypothetical protein
MSLSFAEERTQSVLCTWQSTQSVPDGACLCGLMLMPWHPLRSLIATIAISLFLCVSAFCLNRNMSKK